MADDDAIRILGAGLSGLAAATILAKNGKKVDTHVLEDFSDTEEDRIKDITENIVKLIPTLIEKKIDIFSSKVNENLNGI